jgi:hypothetical protein
LLDVAMNVAITVVLPCHFASKLIAFSCRISSPLKSLSRTAPT